MMQSGGVGPDKRPLSGCALWCIATLLFLLAPAAHGSRAGRASHPSLDKKRLLHAYTPHKRGAEITIEDPDWSPDGRHAGYVVVEKPDPEQGETWNTLYAVRRNGTHIRRLYRWQHPGEHNPTDLQWSPDSSRLVLLIENFTPASSVNADGIELIDIDPETGRRRRLSRGLNGKEYTGSILHKPGYYSFSPNGKYLLLTLGCRRGDMTNKRLVRIDYATGKRKLLTPFHWTALDARWSPDGKHIVYVALPDYGGIDEPAGSDQMRNYALRVRRRHLYIMNADGSHKRRLLAQTGYFESEPTWISKGRKISFVRRKATPEEPRSLWTIRPNGTGLTHVRALPSE